MKIERFSLTKVRLNPNGVWAELLYNEIFVSEIRCNEDLDDFYYTTGDWTNEAMRVSQRLIATYPDSFDGDFYCNDVGDLGIKLEVAYAGEYGLISYLLKELIRLYSLEEIYKEHPSETLLRISYNNILTTYTVPRENVRNYLKQVQQNNGRTFFRAETIDDFNLL